MRKANVKIKNFPSLWALSFLVKIIYTDLGIHAWAVVMLSIPDSAAETNSGYQHFTCSIISEGIWWHSHRHWRDIEISWRGWAMDYCHLMEASHTTLWEQCRFILEWWESKESCLGSSMIIILLIIYFQGRIFCIERLLVFPNFVWKWTHESKTALMICQDSGEEGGLEQKRLT